MDQKKETYIIGGILLVIVLFYAIAISIGVQPNPNDDLISSDLTSELQKFTSEEDFIQYLSQASEQDSFGGGTLKAASMDMDGALDMTMAVEESAPRSDNSATTTTGRVSGTNVQVTGIDEPDIVKTDGQYIYYAYENWDYYWDEPVLLEEDRDAEQVESSSAGTNATSTAIVTDIDIVEPDKILEEYYYAENTGIYQAVPPQDLSTLASLPLYGDLMLADDILIIQTYDAFTAYDVSDPSSPEQVWVNELGYTSNIVTTRLYDGYLYAVTQEWIDDSSPCPVEPLMVGGDTWKVPCTAIYHPVSPVATDATYTVMKIDPRTGDIKADVSVVGSYSNTVVYMSDSSIYLTYNYSADMLEFMLDFFLSRTIDLTPDSYQERLQKLQEYDISSAAKMTELEVILNEWRSSLDDDEQADLEEEIASRMDKYFSDHGRELSRTGIVKIANQDLSIEATGDIPGYPLNQFALDEYDGYLRIATTIESWYFGTDSSMNDVYVLDDELDVAGSILGLGLSEQVYAARFIGDRGYVVTYRQTDPFYVLDLSDPNDPHRTGELKIPGYSAYLHPLADDKILGIGEEDWQVKLSLFDVNDPSDPAELDKYLLDDYWSEAMYNHHAFLLDPDHSIFFLPGSYQGYIFSYEDYQFELVKTIEDTDARRALYIDDFLYILSDDQITVFNENTWQKVKTLDLTAD